MNDIDNGAGIIKTILGPTDKIKFQDIAIQAESERNIMDECVCGEVLTNIIATQPHDEVPVNEKRLAIIKCYECDRAFYTRLEE